MRLEYRCLCGRAESRSVIEPRAHAFEACDLRCRGEATDPKENPGPQPQNLELTFSVDRHRVESELSPRPGILPGEQPKLDDRLARVFSEHAKPVATTAAGGQW